MKHLLIFMLPVCALAVEPGQPAVRVVDGVVVQEYSDGLPERVSWRSNQPRYNQAEWLHERDGVFPAVAVEDVTTNTIDRTAMPTWEKETNLISRAAAALERIAPERPGLQTLAIIKAMTPEQFYNLARRRFAEAADKPAKLADIIEVLALFQESKELGIDWRSDDIGKPTVERTEQVITWEPEN